MDAGVDMVLDTVRTLTRDNDGVVIEPLDLEDGVLRIRYYEGVNEECPECVLPPDSKHSACTRSYRLERQRSEVGPLPVPFGHCPYVWRGGAQKTTPQVVVHKSPVQFLGNLAGNKDVRRQIGHYCTSDFLPDFEDSSNSLLKTVDSPWNR